MRRWLTLFWRQSRLPHLHIACTRRDEKLIESILDAGANIESTICTSSSLWAGFNAMHFAANYHSVQAIKVLLKAGMDHRSKTALGKTARDIVYQDLYDPLIIVDLLEQKETKEHRRKLSNFYVACLNEDHTVMQEFIDHGATEINSECESIFYSGCCLLHCAVEDDSKEKVQILLQNGAKIDCCDYEKRTPLNLALINFFQKCMYTDDVKESQTFNIIELLYSAVEDKMNSHEDSNGLSYFHAAIMCNDLTTVDKYLKEGMVKVNKSPCYTHSSYTPLHMAVHFDCPEIAKLLMEHGASWNAHNRIYGTPLHMACCLKRHNFLQLLLIKNVNFNIVAPLDQQAMLHLIIQLVHSQFDTTYGKVLHDRLLTMGLIPMNIDENIDVNVKDTDGNTALHYLCDYKASYVQMLLNLGADINVKNNEGKVPFLLDENYRWLDSVGYSIVKPLFYHHVQKLKALGLEVDPKNEKICRLIVEKNCDYFEEGELTSREKQRLEEIAKLKSTMIDDNTSLYNFMKLDNEHTKVYAGCETLKNIAEDVDLKYKFQSYVYLIRLKYHASTGIISGEKIVCKSEPFY